MTQKEFIEVLDEKGYSYKIEGDKIIVEGGCLFEICHGERRECRFDFSHFASFWCGV